LRWLGRDFKSGMGACKTDGKSFSLETGKAAKGKLPDCYNFGRLFNAATVSCKSVL